MDPYALFPSLAAASVASVAEPAALAAASVAAAAEPAAVAAASLASAALTVPLAAALATTLGAVSALPKHSTMGWRTVRDAWADGRRHMGRRRVWW